MRKFIIILLLFSITLPFVYAVDIDEKYKEAVYNDRKEIYSLKRMYDQFAGVKEEVEIVYETIDNSASYYWPIGSIQTTTINGKEFALGEPQISKINQEFKGKDVHSGLDIGKTPLGFQTNIIASKSGDVIKVVSNPIYINDEPNYESKYCYKDNISYGNYVIIQHDDGNSTLYGHLSPNSIKVKEGEHVDQGQVIAKMGSTGCSSGAHLHFEIRPGNNFNYVLDPLEYVDISNPRPKDVVNTPSGSISFDELVDYVFTWEGIACESLQTDTEYTACYSSGDNVITVGHGVTWEGTSKLFAKYGIYEMHHGSKVSKDIVDKVGVEALQESYEDLKKDLANAGIDDLKDYQLMALVSQIYNGGYTVIENNKYGYGFIDAYKRYNGKYSFDDVYKNKGSIWYDSMCHPYSPGSDYEFGLKRRRVSEWKLFTTGEIDFYPVSTFNPSDYSWGD